MHSLTVSTQIAIVLFLPLLAAAILAFLTTWISDRSASKNAKAQIEIAAALKLADFRQAWINELRDCISLLQTKSLDVTTLDKPRDESEIERLAYKIHLLMNPNDPNYSELSGYIDSLVGAGDYPTVKKVTSLTQAILKTEWEVLKRDLKYERIAGNAR
jgi:hypothetical protein